MTSNQCSAFIRLGELYVLRKARQITRNAAQSVRCFFLHIRLGLVPHCHKDKDHCCTKHHPGPEPEICCAFELNLASNCKVTVELNRWNPHRAHAPLAFDPLLPEVRSCAFHASSKASLPCSQWKPLALNSDGLNNVIRCQRGFIHPG